MNVYLKQKVFIDEKVIYFSIVSEWYSWYYVFLKQIQKTQNAIDADISFCKLSENKLNMWTTYDCKTK